MRLALALAVLLLAPVALAHGGATVVGYIGGTYSPGAKDAAACVATPVRLSRVVQHVGGACAVEVGHPDQVTVSAHADDLPDAPFFWRMVDGNGSTCAEGEFVGSVAIGGPMDCVRVSVYAPIGSTSGTIVVFG